MEGGPVDRFPVTAVYSDLVYADRFAELTGEPAWRLQAWQNAEPVEHLRLYRRMVEAAPFELLRPWSWAPSPEARGRIEFVERDGRPFRHDRKSGEWTPLDRPAVAGHASDYRANEVARIRDQLDIREKIRVWPASEAIAAGANAYIEAAVREFGADHFIVSGGVVGTVYSFGHYVGQPRSFELMVEDPGLLDELAKRILEQNIEEIQRLAAAGGDAIYIDDATATCDMISPAHYERFSLPYMREMVREIYALGHKAILIYFGGVADRLEQIASIGADGLVMEASMKGYINNIAATVRAIGGRVTFFANIDPIGVIQDGTDSELETEIRHQVEAGRQGRGFVISAASSITPATPLSRIRRHLELGRTLGAVGAGLES